MADSPGTPTTPSSPSEVSADHLAASIPPPARRHRGPTSVNQPGKMARPLDPDIPAWMQQPGESGKAYAEFLAFRDSEDRVVANHGPTAPKWSAWWSWGYRTWQWDQYLATKEQEDAVRWRRKMNDRQRRIGQYVQQRVLDWLQKVDLSGMSVSEASRLLEVGARIERLAAGGDAHTLVTVSADGQDIGDMTAEQVAEALAGLQSEIGATVIEPGEPDT